MKFTGSFLTFFLLLVLIKNIYIYKYIPGNKITIIVEKKLFDIFFLVTSQHFNILNFVTLSAIIRYLMEQS